MICYLLILGIYVYVCVCIIYVCLYMYIFVWFDVVVSFILYVTLSFTYTTALVGSSDIYGKCLVLATYCALFVNLFIQ